MWRYPNPRKVSRSNARCTSLLLKVVPATVLLLSYARDAGAQEMNRPNFIGGEAGADAALLGSSVLGVALGALFIQPNTDSNWGPDTPHPYNKTADSISNFTGAIVGMVGGIGLGYGAEILQLDGQADDALFSPLILTEGASLSLLVNILIKNAAGRCRPWAYQGDHCVPQTADDLRAFPSGHVATIGGVAGTQLGLSIMAGSDSGWRWAAFGVMELATLATAILRVNAGAHSLSDVASSWAISHAVGVGTALIHPRYTYPDEVGTSTSALQSRYDVLDRAMIPGPSFAMPF